MKERCDITDILVGLLCFKREEWANGYLGFLVGKEKLGCPFKYNADDDIICDVSTQVSCWDFDTGLDTSFYFILGDITSHMAMKYSVGHTLKEILASSLTINTTVPPSLYWDVDHHPP